MRTFARLLISVVVFSSLVGLRAYAQEGGDANVAERAVEPATAAAAEAARRAIGASPALVTGVGVFLTPSSTASSAQSECNGTTNCTQSFPSTPPPPPPLPPAPPAPIGYLPPPPPSEPQFTVPEE
jgi:hypothetical protein